MRPHDPAGQRRICIVVVIAVHGAKRTENVQVLQIAGNPLAVLEKKFHERAQLVCLAECHSEIRQQRLEEFLGRLLAVEANQLIRNFGALQTSSSRASS